MIAYELRTRIKTEKGIISPVEIRLEPELARLCRTYRNTALDLKKADKLNQDILKLRLMKKLHQTRDRLEGRLLRLLGSQEEAKKWVDNLENMTFTEETECSGQA